MNSSDRTIQTINSIIAAAEQDGRNVLFEHEVYAILALIGLEPPAHHLITDVDDITPALLRDFHSDRIVLKAVSTEMAHKQKLGGVRVALKDLDFIRYSCSAMYNELSHLNMIGILLVDHIEYDRDLGNEVLLGFRESESFGPVISFSKGGSDAEHFAAHFSDPNIILAPVDNAWADAFLSSTQIHYKYLEEGKTGYIDMISEVTVKLSEISCAFSSFFQSAFDYVLSEFEVNPIVFDTFGRMIPLDGFATFQRKTSHGRKQISPHLPSIEPFFIPSGVAVVGVSRSDPNNPGNIVAENLLKLGRNDVYCVNPKGGSVHLCGEEVPLYKTLGELPSKAELVVIATPAAAVEDVFRNTIEFGAKAVLITAGGFSESTGDTSSEKEMLKLARSAGVRVMGPNCLGVINLPPNASHGVNTFFIPKSKFTIGANTRRNVVLISQSGAAGIVEINNLRNALSPKTVVSYGNQLDIDPCDLVLYFSNDPDIKVIGCYIEGFKPAAGRAFFDAAQQTNIPIVVYKAGRTEIGAKATASHTASIAGEYSVARAALKQAGMVVADTMLDHMGYIKTFALLDGYAVRGRGVAIVTNAGYEKTNAADHLGSLIVPEVERTVLDKLASLLPPFVHIEPLLDLTPMVTDEQFAESIDALLSSETVHSICISIVPQAQLIHTTDEEMARYQQNVATRIVDIVNTHRKPAVVSFTVESGSDSNYNAFSKVLEAGGIPTFLSAERAMMFLNAFINYHLTRLDRNLSERLR